jgi:hypothetical protein
LEGTGNRQLAARGRQRQLHFTSAAYIKGKNAALTEMLRDFDPKMRRTLSRMWTEIKVR